MDKNRPAKNEPVLTKRKSYSVTENRDRMMAGTTRNCGEKTYKYSSISKLWALYKNDDPPSVEDEEEEDEQDEEEEDADDEDDDDAALFAHGTVGDAAAGDNDDELVDDPDDDVPLAQSLSKPKKDTDDKGRNKDKAIKLRRPFTHVDFVAKRHDSWRFQHPFFAPQKSISFFRPTPRGFSSWDTTTLPFVASRGVCIHPLFRAENCII